MSTAMYSGVAGLKSQQTKLDVIGNNIANISTAGYKSQRVTFSDILSQTLAAASGPNASRGGTNPMQVGLGVSVSAIDTDMTTGSTQSTGNSMDVSIGGDGFFIVKGGTNSEYEFTRAGNFGVDKQGNLTVNGLEVCGWQAYTTNADGTTTYNTQTTVEPINVFSDSINGSKKVIPPKATSTETLSGNLDPTKTAKGTALNNIGAVPATADSVTTMTVYDTEGNSYDIQVNLSKCYTDASTNGATTGNVDLSTLTYPYTISSTANNLTLAVDGAAASEITIPTGTYTSSSALITAINTGINNNANLKGRVTASLDSSNQLVFTSTSTGSGSGVTVTDGTTTTGALAALVGTTTAANGTNHSDNTSWYWEAVSSSNNMTIGAPSSGYLEFDSNGKLITTDSVNYNTTPSISLKAASGVGSGVFSVKLDMTGISTYTSTSENKVSAAGDGYAAGDLNDISIGSDGIITGAYTNGQKQPLGMIALASFANSAGLQKVGDNLYITTTNSGDFTGGVEAGSNGTGSLSAGTLEGSNVDLAQQFSDMMITQRSYQANSKVITTSDSMMETLINMVR